jgi:uncharacterized protein YbcI
MVHRFEHENMGREPKEIHTDIVGKLVVVRLKGVLTETERHFMKVLPSEKERDIFKQVCNHLVETARAMIHSLERADHRRVTLPT